MKTYILKHFSSTLCFCIEESIGLGIILKIRSAKMTKINIQQHRSQAFVRRQITPKYNTSQESKQQQWQHWNILHKYADNKNE